MFIIWRSLHYRGLHLELATPKLEIRHSILLNWYSSNPGCKWDDNLLAEVSSVEWLARLEPVDQNKPSDAREHDEHCFFWGSYQCGSSWGRFFRTSPYWTWDYVQEDPTLISSDNVTEINVRWCLQDLDKRFSGIDSNLPMLLREHVWDPFQIIILKTNGFGHMPPDHDSWNVQVFTQSPQSRERSFKLSFQDRDINVIQRRSSAHDSSPIKTWPILNLWIQWSIEARV
jgi:hypothetical protein